MNLQICFDKLKGKPNGNEWRIAGSFCREYSGKGKRFQKTWTQKCTETLFF